MQCGQLCVLDRCDTAAGTDDHIKKSVCAPHSVFPDVVAKAAVAVPWHGALFAAVLAIIKECSNGDPCDLPNQPNQEPHLQIIVVLLECIPCSLTAILGMMPKHAYHT